MHFCRLNGKWGIKKKLSVKLEAPSEFLRACAMLLNFVINCVSQSLVEGDELDDEQWITIIILGALARTFLKDLLICARTFHCTRSYYQVNYLGLRGNLWMLSHDKR